MIKLLSFVVIVIIIISHVQSVPPWSWEGFQENSDSASVASSHAISEPRSPTTRSRSNSEHNNHMPKRNSRANSPDENLFRSRSPSQSSTTSTDAGFDITRNRSPSPTLRSESYQIIEERIDHQLYPEQIQLCQAVLELALFGLNQTYFDHRVQLDQA